METIEQFITKDPVCCTPESSLQMAAAAMIKNDCGELPVVDNLKDLRIVGVITDRDICCRTLGKGLNPMEMKVGDVMTFPAITVTQYSSIVNCVEMMEKNKIRRMPVVDDYEKVCGIISLADISLKKQEVGGAILREVSRPKETFLHQ
jgi:CBS domain-containing protein